MFIIDLFLSIGFEHVNIIDATCREIHDGREPETIIFITRQHSDEEVENYEEWEKKRLIWEPEIEEKTANNKRKN